MTAQRGGAHHLGFFRFRLVASRWLWRRLGAEVRGAAAMGDLKFLDLGFGLRGPGKWRWELGFENEEDEVKGLLNIPSPPLLISAGTSYIYIKKKRLLFTPLLLVSAGTSY